MKVFLGDILLTNEAVLSVTDANQDLNFTDWTEKDLVNDEDVPSLINSIPSAFHAKMMRLAGSLEVVHSDTGFIFTSKYGRINIKVLLVNGRGSLMSLHSPGFLPPGVYRLTLKNESYTFTVKPSGQVYSLFPSLLRLPNDLMRVVAACDNMTIAQIWDMDKNLLTDYFWKSLASHRLTENSDYLNKPIFEILDDLHYLDQNPLDSIPFFDEERDLGVDDIQFWLKFDKLKSKLLERGDLFHLVEEDLLMVTFNADYDPIEENLEILNGNLETLFPGITKFPLHLAGKEERKEWRNKIYLSIFCLLNEKQLCRILAYVRDHPAGMSRRLVKKMLEYVETTYGANPDQWNIDLSAYDDPEISNEDQENEDNGTDEE